MSHYTIQLGMRDGWGQKVPFGIGVHDMRQHLYLAGKSGSGKTTLMLNMMTQLIADGHGVGFIDPHGDSSGKLMSHIPVSRLKHVLYFNPSDLEHPPAMNLLANVQRDQRHLTASGIVGAFRSIWRDSWGPRMEFILYNALAALLDCQNVSLLGVNRMLTDDTYRSWVIRQIKDPFIRDFWERDFENYEPRFRQEAISPIQNKLGQFLLNPAIRNILGQTQCKVDFPFVMDNKRIFIANLSKGKLGEDKANLLGSLLVNQFQLAAMRRADQPEAERKDFFLFVDEFQNFTTDSFVSALSEIRKYRLSLVLAHQYIEQVPRETRQAIFGNAGTLISFRVGHSDAEALQKEFGGSHTFQQFVDLENYEVIARLMENGRAATPFKGTTLHPIETPSARRESVLKFSQERYTTPRAEVEDQLSRSIRGFTSNSGTSPQKPQNRRSGESSSAPKSSLESEEKRTKRYPGGVLPI